MTRLPWRCRRPSTPINGGKLSPSGEKKSPRELLQDLDSVGKMDKATYAALLRWCGDAGELSLGHQVHARIATSSCVHNTFLSNLLVQMYGKCRDPHSARSVFDGMGRKDIFSWNLIIAAYAQNGFYQEALQLFTQLQVEGMNPDKFTFLPLLSASASVGRLAQGKCIHLYMVNNSFEADVSLETALINMYGKCGRVKDARLVFDGMRQRNVISWTAMITTYAQNTHSEEAFSLFHEMESEGLQPDSITFLSILDVCADMGSLRFGRVMHGRIIASGCKCESVATLNTALLNMYGKCGSIDEAYSVFLKAYQGNVTVVLWNAMIAAYTQNGYNNEALELFRWMDLESIKPDRITLLSILDACTSLSSLKSGKQMHAYIVAFGFELLDALGIALLNMYGKCGVLKSARILFNKIHQRTTISWTAIIGAYAQNGHSDEALELFTRMRMEGIKPDGITFLNILNACSHAGLVEKGRHHFFSMSREYAILPSKMHYVCMIDLLGRAGHLDEAEEMAKNTCLQSNALPWVTLLGSCQLHADVERGVRAAKHALRLDPRNSTTYVLLWNIYAAAGRREDAARVRKAMEQLWIQTGNNAHVLVSLEEVH